MEFLNGIIDFFSNAFQRVQSTFTYVVNNVRGAREAVDHYTEIGTAEATPVANLQAAITAVGSSATPAEVTTASGLAAAAYLPQARALQHPTVQALQAAGATISFIGDRAIIAEKPGELIVAFRGTQVPENGIGIDNAFNAACISSEFPGIPGARVHSGFLACYHSLPPSLRDQIRLAVQRGDRVTLAGHSQGGALAQLAAADAQHDHAEGNIRLITFGAPRVGNHQFVEHMPHDHLRFVNARDPIPALATPGCGFEHAVRPVIIRDGQFCVGTLNENGTLISTIASSAVGFISPDRFNAAHAQVNYDRALNGLPVAPPAGSSLPPHTVKENAVQAAGAITGSISHGLPFGLVGNPALQAAR